MLYASSVLVLSLYLGSIQASIGDRSIDFRRCVSRCEGDRCHSGAKLDDVSLRVLGWSCEENCRYDCMRSVTDDDVKFNRPIRQFYGKWPFIRFYGIQEPASSIFSLLNGLTVTIGHLRYSSAAPHSYPPSFAVRCQFWVTLNAWFWSTVFHARDFPWTEKLDYFSAAGLIIAGIVVQFVRITGPSAVLWHIAYLSLWVFLFVAHITYLSLYRFDYGYNMAASVSAGVFYTAIWLLWTIKHFRERRYVWKCAVVVICTSCFLLLELFDFPPILWVFDAHSLWHLSTVALPLLWYSFLTDDAKFEVQVKLRKQV